MARYQIRAPENEVIEDIIKTMATKSWEILNAWKVFQAEPSKEQFEGFHQAIHSRMAPYVRTYKLCGMSNICLDDCLSTPWAEKPHELDASPRDLVYHLFPAKGLEEFLKSLTESSVESIRVLLKPEAQHQTLSILEAAFRTILGEYLYFNPLCGKTELCVYSQSSPQKPWGRPKN